MATATKSKGTPGVLEIPPLEIAIAHLTVIGDTELIVNRWSEKAKGEMRDAQGGKPRSKKAPKDPQAEYEAAFYRLPDGTPALRTIAFKCAMVAAARHVAGVTMTQLWGAFHTVGELVAIAGVPHMREDMVRVGGAGPGTGTADLRYRPGFPEWSVRLTIRYNRRSITLGQLVHLANQAGFSDGVCEWRPPRHGTFGLFHVDGVEAEEPIGMNGQH